MGRGIERMIQVLNGWTLVCLYFLFLCGNACAEDTEPILPKHAFSIGGGASYFEYVEDVPLGEVKIDGPMFEVVGGYTYHNNIMFSASLSYSIGDLDYEGFAYTDSMGWAPSRSDRDTEIVEARALVGYDYIFRGRHIITPFVGIGYRYWSDVNEAAFGSEREIEYWYSPIGITTHSPLSNTWNWGMSLEYDLFWSGDVDSGIADIPTINQDSGYGVRFSLCFIRPLPENVGLSFEPYITYWDIDRARELVYTAPGAGSVWAVEPENDTTTYGLRVSIRF